LSVHRRERAGGHVVWQVTWRDRDGRQRAETYVTRREAERRDGEITDMRWEGKLELADAGGEPLRDAVESWWMDHVEPNLARNTITSYAHVLDYHLLPRLGDVAIRDIDPARVVALQREMHEAHVGDWSIHRTLMVLSGVLRHAVLRGRIVRNPVQPVRVRQPKRTRAIRPFAPASVERLRRAMLARDDEASATLVSLMAYAGLRPGEATALAWEHVGNHTLLVERSSDDGESKGTKTGRIRTVRLLAPLAEDLSAWRHASGAPDDSALIFPRPDGRGWTLDDYRNWHRRRFNPAATTAGLHQARPYDLRHSFASLMIQAGYSPVELSAELGHAPTLTLDTYAHMFSEFARGDRVDPEGEIRTARK
jgi:integrase